jgi:hypothetical protein
VSRLEPPFYPPPLASSPAASVDFPLLLPHPQCLRRYGVQAAFRSCSRSCRYNHLLIKKKRKSNKKTLPAGSRRVASRASVLSSAVGTLTRSVRRLPPSPYPPSSPIPSFLSLHSNKQSSPSSTKAVTWDDSRWRRASYASHAQPFVVVVVSVAIAVE